jgi:hypothetical protein
MKIMNSELLWIKFNEITFQCDSRVWNEVMKYRSVIRAVYGIPPFGIATFYVEVDEENPDCEQDYREILIRRVKGIPRVAGSSNG